MRSCGLRAGVLAGALWVMGLAANLPAQPKLPVAVANNAVAAGHAEGAWWVFSVLGIDTTKRWSGITRMALAWVPGMREWRPLPDVPGPVGRLAATAQVVRGHLHVFGGYTVDSTGAEHSVDVVDVYDPQRGTWTSRPPMPVSVDDAVSVTWRDSLVYLISGWHNTDNVQSVQVYDAVKQAWSIATPIPGPGVFGHTGALAGNTIVYIDGAARQVAGPKYGLVPQTWTGEIDPARPLRIMWRATGVRHPGPPRYRGAAWGCGSQVVFAGGTANPYNYDGVGYDGNPSQPLSDVIAFDTRRATWLTLRPAPVATMDHRALLIRGDTAIVVGGMVAGQRVTDTITRWTLGACPS
jgi:N-acetylneuraminic acid mutarotase